MAALNKIMLACAAVLAGILTIPASAQAPDIVGDWHGALDTPRGALTLILHVTREGDGSLKAELQSPDQGPGSIPASEVTLAGEHLTFRIAQIGANYEGDWEAATQQWRGTFSQGGQLPLALSRGLPPKRPVVEGLDGRWEGTVERGGATLRLVLRVRTAELGTIAALDSPDQLANGVPVSGLARDGRSVVFDVPSVKSHFAGTLSDDSSQLSGVWTRPEVTDAVTTFTRSSETAVRQPRARPQTPSEPFPYKSEEVAFDNPRFAEVHLAGTLTLPQGEGPFPAAVLITGSGAQDRDEALLGHRPFAVIADYLTRHGIVVLRFDDRGVGKSTGDYGAATSADLATDANAAFAYLRGRGDIRRDAVGFIGHSEGGMIGPIAMAENPDVAFLVMLAGPGTALDTLLLSQRRLIGSQMGLSEADLDRGEPILAAVFRAVASGDTAEEGRENARAVLTPEAMTALGAPGADPTSVLQQVTGPWFSYFLKYDPAPNLARIRVPVLALNGSLDRQVPPRENLAAVREALRGNPDATAIELPGLNHLFQTARTGAVGEYADIEETFAPIALEAMTQWISERFVKR